MFNSEFFPTPKEVLYSMNLDCLNKVILEPHAGKGQKHTRNENNMQTLPAILQSWH